MAVVFDSSTSKAVAVAGSATTGSVSAPIVVNTNADDLYALVGVEWIGPVDISAATFAVQFGGHAMTLIGQVYWGSNHYTVLLFGLDDPPDGSQSVVASVSGVPTGGATRKLRMVAATYSGTDGPGTPVLSTPATTSSNTVTVPSGAAADRVVAVHAASTLQYAYSNYSLTKRARSVDVPNPIDYLLGDRGEDLLLGDAPGAASVTSTATQQSSANWGAIGVSLAPAAVNWDVGLALRAPVLAMGMAVYRGGNAAPDRTWLLDAGFVGVQDTRIGPAGPPSPIDLIYTPIGDASIVLKQEHVGKLLAIPSGGTVTLSASTLPVGASVFLFAAGADGLTVDPTGVTVLGDSDVYLNVAQGGPAWVYRATEDAWIVSGGTS